MSQDIYILSAVRTPIGSFLGSLADVPAPQLGAVAIKAAVERAGVKPELVDEVYMGCVLQAAQGQAPARQAMIGAGLPVSTSATTVHKVCGSGMKTVMMARNDMLAGDLSIAVTGGMESMSQSPYYVQGARTGFKMGHQQLVDSMIYDGLWDPYNDFHMGNAGEMCAGKYSFSREDQDAYAAETYRRAKEAIASGVFDAEIAPVNIPQRKGEPLVVSSDEEPLRGGEPDKLAKLRPAFQRDGGTITAGNASPLNDGAAAMVIASGDAVAKHGFKPIAKILGVATYSQEPAWFTTAPIGAIKKLLEKTNLTLDDIDLFEVNEAFSVVAMAVMKELNISHDKLNVNGGAVALGHPIGASGCRIMVTMLHALKARGKKRGIATICLGGGEAVAMALELV